MLQRRFVCKLHDEFGCLGWQPLDMPEADPLSGMAVAHDVLEHFPGDTGSAEGELQALGAALWLRGVGGYWHRFTQQNDTNPGSNVGADLPDVMAHVFFEGHRFNPPRFGGVALDGEAEEWINEAIRGYLSEARERFDGDERHLAVCKETTDQMRRYMRHGYRRARRRYGRGRGWDSLAAAEMSQLFYDIEQSADKALARAEEGYELLVRVSLRRREAVVHLIEPWEGVSYE